MRITSTIITLTIMFCGLGAPASLHAVSPSYHLAIKEYPAKSAEEEECTPAGIHIFHLDEKGQILKETILSASKDFLYFCSDGKVFFYKEAKGAEGTLTHVSLPMGGNVRKLYEGPRHNPFLQSKEFFTPVFDAKSPQFLKDIGGFLSGGFFLPIDVDPRGIEFRLSWSILLSSNAPALVFRSRVVDPSMPEVDWNTFGTIPKKSSPCYDCVIAYDPLQSIFQHISGTNTDRYFVKSFSLVQDKKIVFQRIRNYESLLALPPGTLRAQIFEEEGGYELCLYDFEIKSLQVLVPKGCRSQEFPMTNPRWAPNGKRLLFEYSKEPFLSDKVHNEAEGVYVYDFEKGEYYRPTSKWAYERAVCWAPDSEHYLIQRWNPPDSRVQGRNLEEPGYFIVNAATGEMKPLLIFENEFGPGFPRTANGISRLNFSFLASAWSPDGRYIAFCATRKKGNVEYQSLIIMQNDGSGEKIVLYEIPKEEKGPDGKPARTWALTQPTWLNY